MDINIDLLKEIYGGWKKVVFPTKKTEELAKKRIKICLQCKKDDGTPMMSSTTKRCGICKCFMPAKVRNEKSRCPLGKW